MSAAATAATPAATPAKPKGRKKLLYILLALIVVGLLAAGGALYLLKMNTADDEYADEEDEVTQSEPERSTTPPTFLPLDNMVVNLADAGGSRFVQIGISLQIENAETGEEMKKYMPSIRSSVLLLISQRTSEELLLLPGKEKLAKDIVADISRIMGYRMPEPPAAGANGAAPKRKSKLPPNPVQAVLFSSFIVQ